MRVISLYDYISNCQVGHKSLKKRDKLTSKCGKNNSTYINLIKPQLNMAMTSKQPNLVNSTDRQKLRIEALFPGIKQLQQLIIQFATKVLFGST